MSLRHALPGAKIFGVIVREGGRSSNHGIFGLAKDRSYWVYILATKIGGTLYVGVTNNLVRRIYEHKEGLAKGFTKKYEIHRLVYFEQHADIEAGIRREKRLKSWNRAWKIRLIEESNPNWVDLYPGISSP